MDELKYGDPIEVQDASTEYRFLARTTDGKKFYAVRAHDHERGWFGNSSNWLDSVVVIPNHKLVPAKGGTLW